MNGGPDESVQPGECPLCLVHVPEPTATLGVIPILARHFGTTCAATRLATGLTPRATSA